MKGPGGMALVHADMYKDEARQWQYTYLLVDHYAAAGGGSSATPQRVHIVSPK